ncbi:MAG: YlbF family regulator [Syntrophomonadaceae bacterium]|nr:YlbF family regulator [Syntrophomonadaceae bacterium]
MTKANPYDKAHELARALEESQLYLEYIEAQKKLAQNPEALKKVQEFRAQQMKVNQASMMGQEPDPNLVTELPIQFAKLNLNKQIAQFFEAEGKFVQMFTDIQQILQTSLEKGFQD